MSSKNMIKVSLNLQKRIYLDPCIVPVFLGHKIPAMSHSMNIRDLIAKRALACAESPLIFDYNQRDNCEAFANLMTGAADPEEGKLGAQENNTPCIFACICGLIRCCKCCQKKRSLADVVRERLQEAKKAGKLD